MGLENREKFAVAVALAALALLGGVWFSLRGTTKRISTNDIAAGRAASDAMLQGRWRDAIMYDTAVPNVEQQFAETLAVELEDTNRILTSEQRRLLVKTVARYLKARWVETADEHVALVSSETGTRWVTPADSDEWARIDGWFEFSFGAAPDRSDPQSALRRMIQKTVGTERFAGFGTGKRGLLAFAFRARAVEQIDELVWDYVESRKKEESEYWLHAPTAGAVRFRVPVRSVGKVIEEENGALVATTMVAVATKGETTFSWFCLWYWDGQSNSWQCDKMMRKGKPGLLY